MIDIYKVSKELKEIGYPKNVLYKYDFLELTTDLTTEEADNIIEGISNLKDIDKEIFGLRFKDCLTCPEIAEKLSIKTSQVTNRLDRALFLFVKVLKEKELVKNKPREPKGKMYIKL